MLIKTLHGQTPKIPFKDVPMGGVFLSTNYYFIKCGETATACLHNGSYFNSWRPESLVTVALNAIMLPEGEK